MNSTLSSVRNALEILHLLRVRGPLRLSEVASALGVGTSTAHRLISTLREARFIRQQSATRRYELGPAMLFAASTSAIEHCVTVSAPVMGELRERTGETVHLSVLRGAECVFVASVESTQLVRVTSRVGQHPSAHAAAAGKVLLAELPADGVQELFPDEDLRASTARTVATRALLIEQLAQVTNSGYARNIGETEPDMYAIAVPLHRPDGTVITSLSVAAPISRMAPAPHQGDLSPQELGMLAELRESAHRIEASLIF